MAAEYTQVFSFAIGGAGISAIQYCELGVGTPPPADSVFVVKFMSASSSTGLNGGAGALTLSVTTSDDNAGTNAHNVVNTGTAVAANVGVVIATGLASANGFVATSVLKDFICTQPYLGVSANMIGAGTLTVTVSYIVIPSTNALSANFRRLATATTNGSGSILGAPSSAETFILKSMSIINTTGGSLTFQPILYASGAPLTYLSTVSTLAANATACYYFPLYLQQSTTFQIGYVANGVMPVYTSYILSATP